MNSSALDQEIDAITAPTVRPITAERWYDVAKRFADWGYRHSHAFNVQCGKQQHTAVEHVEISDGGEAIGLASARIKRLPLIGVGIAYVGGGPLTRTSASLDVAALARCLEALRREYVLKRGLVLRVSPPLAPQDEIGLATSTYLAAGFKPTPMATVYRTMLLDLSPSIEQITSRFSKRWRRQLNKSLKSGFELQIGTSLEMFDQFCDLFEEFIDWKGFEVEHGPRFHREVHKALPEDARYFILLARQADKLAGGVVLARTGDTAVYVLGATNPAMRDARPGHYLHFRATELLKEKGLRYYDLGGINPENNPGVYEFKAGMTQVDLCAPPPMECAPGFAKKLMLDAAEWGYRKYLEIKRGAKAPPTTAGPSEADDDSAS